MPSIFYPYLVDNIGSVQTIHRELAKRLHGRYTFTGFVWSDPDKITEYFDEYVNVHNRSRPLKAYLYSKPYLRNFDLVHTGQPSHFMRNRYLTKLPALRTNLVYTIHTPMDVQTPAGQYVKEITAQADIVTAVYPYVEEWAKESLGLTDVRVIFNGVDFALFHPDQAATDPKYILYVARFSDDKHPEFPTKLGPLLPKFEFHVAGGYPADSKLINDIPDNVTYHGEVSKPQLAKMYASASALLCPFEEHGAGMVALEAAASGTPVIALDTGASSTTVPEGAGLLCKSLDPNEWADVVRTICEDPPALNPRDAISQFSWENVVERYDEVYRELLCGH